MASSRKPTRKSTFALPNSDFRIQTSGSGRLPNPDFRNYKFMITRVCTEPHWRVDYSGVGGRGLNGAVGPQLRPKSARQHPVGGLLSSLCYPVFFLCRNIITMYRRPRARLAKLPGCSARRRAAVPRAVTAPCCASPAAAHGAVL